MHNQAIVHRSPAIDKGTKRSSILLGGSGLPRAAAAGQGRQGGGGGGAADAGVPLPLLPAGDLGDPLLACPWGSVLSPEAGTSQEVSDGRLCFCSPPSSLKPFARESGVKISARRIRLPAASLWKSAASSGSGGDASQDDILWPRGTRGDPDKLMEEALGDGERGRGVGHALQDEGEERYSHERSREEDTGGLGGIEVEEQKQVSIHSPGEDSDEDVVLICTQQPSAAEGRDHGPRVSEGRRAPWDSAARCNAASRVRALRVSGSSFLFLLEITAWEA